MEELRLFMSTFYILFDSVFVSSFPLSFALTSAGINQTKGNLRLVLILKAYIIYTWLIARLFRAKKDREGAPLRIMQFTFHLT